MAVNVVVVAVAVAVAVAEAGRGRGRGRGRQLKCRENFRLELTNLRQSQRVEILHFADQSGGWSQPRRVFCFADIVWS